MIASLALVGCRLSMVCFSAGATIGTIFKRGPLTSGRSAVRSAVVSTGARTGGGGCGISTSTIGFSGSGGLTLECLDTVQPLMLRNSVKSTLFFWQHDHPLYTSWKKGTPGWWRHASVEFCSLGNIHHQFISRHFDITLLFPLFYRHKKYLFLAKTIEQNLWK